MPELPEVQTVVSTLQTQIDQLLIKDVIVYYPKMIQNDVDDFKSQVKNQRIVGFHRRGKYILLELTKGYLIIHLRMEGRFFIRENLKENKHVHVVFILSNNKVLHYQDTRKFGTMEFVNNKDQLDKALSHLGLEATDVAFNGEYLYEHAKTKKRSLKSFLLAQDVVAGIGNIYADEICFYAKLHPAIACHKISKKKWHVIALGIQEILHQATQCGGSSIRSYTDSLGISGRFQLSLKVHMRQHQSCVECHDTIIKTVVANRGTYLCPTCQKRR